MNFLKKYWFSLAVLGVLLIAIGFRFYHFSTRWGLATDQANDATIARHALKIGKLSMRGPFSSGANMISGPQWYWLITFFTWLYPQSILSPWVGIAILYVVFVYVMIKIGQELGGKYLGLLTGLITAFSPLEISQGVSLTNQSPMAIISAVSLWAMIKYLKFKKPIFAFVFGTGIALAVNIHLQAIGLLFLIPVIAFLGWPHSWPAFLSFVLGFVLQFIPLIIFDLQRDFYNLRGLLSYYLFDQYKIGVSSRWLIYVFSFWPSLWTKISGGYHWLSFIQGIGISFLTAWLLIKKKLKKPILALVLGFILAFVSLRYYRGPRFESYHVFLHPFILFFSAWFIYYVFRWQKLVGGMILVLVLFGALQLNLAHYRVEKNGLYPQIKDWEQALKTKFPNQKFAFYAYKFEAMDKTNALVLVLDIDNLIDDKGMRIGVYDKAPFPALKKQTVFTDGRYCLIDISKIKKEGDDWAFLNPSEIWKATEEW